VGILDSGCGAHPWLDAVVRRDVALGQVPIGYTAKDTDPEIFGDQLGPLDGAIDALSGHGTFIAGLVHQTCPDAEILSWRVVPSEGPIIESDLVAALSQIAELARRHRAREADGHPLDVLNLSMGYYHETPNDPLFDPVMRTILTDLGSNGVVVVAAAGNDATSRPMYPAAFAASPPGVESLPVVSVGALNPNGVSDALFSNVGTWVSTYRPGAAVMSTMPAFQGGLEPVARTNALGRPREAIDPDDFRGRFAVWSGTSFSAPIAAGAVAAAMVGQLEAGGSQVDDPQTAVAKGWEAVQACLTS
jgi:subtilisin family serine protease